MAEIDTRAQQEYGIPGLLLMENAGQKALATWRRLEEEQGRHLVESGAAVGTSVQRLVFVAGKGNNGGDALVMARQAHIDRLGEVTVVPVAAELKGKAAEHLEIVKRLGIRVRPWDTDGQSARDAISCADVVFDGIAGTGIKGGLRAPLSDIVSVVNESGARVVAVDVPSGIADDFQRGSPLVEADTTLTMGLPKRCLYLPAARPAAGHIRRIALGFPPELTDSDALSGRLLETDDVSRLVPAPRESDYKHRRGVLAVFAGARGTSGAAVLAATAAARSTAGMVRVFADEAVYPVLASQCRSVMVVERGAELPDLEGHTALLVGPGWGRGERRERDLSTLLEASLPGVLDADGINILSGMRAGRRAPGLGGRWVITPHAGELARLTGRSGSEVLAGPFDITGETARELDAVVVLKSHVTIITAPDGRYGVVDGMNRAMGTGGAGDVLAGIIAGFLSRGLDPFDAACAGTALHDAIGKRYAAERGYFLAEDLLDGVSEELGKLLS
jgi:NAD(P)H-hydrate epimerase